ncbi:hypothetical protein [Thermococcus sp.]|uniref:hypothetical protein n=1 Tax=Thermococcus sp. TaxID=35749 RepID=UPI0026227FBF|nr:hypothetical protein [Thermococcus sp.]
MTLERNVLKIARFLSTFVRGFVSVLIFGSLVAVEAVYKSDFWHLLGSWLKFGIIFGVLYAHGTYLEFSKKNVERGLPSWAAERVAQSLIPWILLDSIVMFGVVIPVGGYISGLLYVACGFPAFIVAITVASTVDGLFRGWIYSRIGLPEKPGFIYIKIAGRIVKSREKAKSQPSS